MAKKHSFKGTFINVLKHNKDGSFGTQASRRKILLQSQPNHITWQVIPGF